MGSGQSKQVAPKEKEADHGQKSLGTLAGRKGNSAASFHSTDRGRHFDEASRRKGSIINVSAAKQENITTLPADWSIYGTHQKHGLEHNIHIPNGFEQNDNKDRKSISNYNKSYQGIGTTDHVSKLNDSRGYQSKHGVLHAEQDRSSQGRTTSRGQDNVDTVDGTSHHKTSINQNMSERDTIAEVNKQLLQQLQRLDIENKEIKFERDKMEEAKNELIGQKSRLEGHLHQLQRELNEMRTRLSRIASNSLTDNNPNIADLSDQNRPTKLADRFQELYCNEWSGAYEDLTKTWNKTEKQAVQILLDLIKNIYTICLETSERQEADLKSQIMVYTGNPEFSSELSQAMKPFKDRRKKMFQNFLPGILQEIKKSRGDTGNNGTQEQSKKIQQYIDLSTELCWLMCIQDPKVHLYTECREGSVFDEANFSAYTVRGTVVDYLVWPSLHLHKGGALLKKGVAQGKGGGEKRKR